MTSGPGSITVIGAGGVGSLLAARLARAGHEVWMLARGGALAAIRERGLAVRGPDGDHRVPLARVSDDARELGPTQIALVAVKTWQLAELGPRLVPLVGRDTLVVPMQNGVQASEVLERSLGDAHVVGAVSRMISWIERPGEIRWMGERPSIVIGARHPGQADAVQACARTLRTGGIDVVIAEDIDRARWLKFLFIVPYAALGAIERAPLGALRTSPAVRARMEAVMREIEALSAALGVALPGDAVAYTFARIDALPEDTTASMHRDIVAGRPSELNELLGAVVELGRKAGVATPVCDDLYGVLEPLERRARAR